jgi:coenzyme PQQ precursor peptide PqqA
MGPHRHTTDPDGDNHDLDHPAYQDLRFGFEITMYIAAR